jgi:N-acetylmuramoyl-L-alanine amidase
MKAAFASILLGVTVWAGMQGSASGVAGSVEPVALFGREYVRLNDWARDNNYSIQWLKHDESIQLSNRSFRLVFDVDSREAEINGANLRLCYPVALRNGSAWVSMQDIDATLKPVLYPPHNRNGAKVRTIVLDPGHGGKDPGFQDGSRQEKKYTLLLAQELSDQLKRAGFKVSLTRTTDTLIDLPERPEIARRRGADLFISLHWNSAGSVRSDVRGAETYCLTPAGAPSSNADGEVLGAGVKPGNRFDEKNVFLAYLIQKSLHRNLGVEDRGVHRARFWVLRDAQMPAVLVEGGFMSHPIESKHIYDPGYRKKMAYAIVEAVQAYKAQVEQLR